MTEFTIIAAVASNGVIGMANAIPWYLASDLVKFKERTWGKPIIMGRKTYESLPIRPLPGRRHIVYSKQEQTRFNDIVEYVSSDEEMLRLTVNDHEAMVIGGSSIYKHFMPYSTNMYITLVEYFPAGDTFFPKIDTDEWCMTVVGAGRENDLIYEYRRYERVHNFKDLRTARFGKKWLERYG